MELWSSGELDNDTRNNRLNFDGDPDHCADYPIGNQAIFQHSINYERIFMTFSG